MEPSIAVQRTPEAIILTAQTGRLDQGAIQRIKRESDLNLASPKRLPLVINLARLEVASSLLMGTLVDLLKKLEQHGVRLVLCEIPDAIHESFSVTRIQTMFEIYDTTQDALSALQKHRAKQK